MEILRVKRGSPEKAVKIIIKALKEEKVLICPTDTIYGLVADATSRKAVNKIFEIKKRSKSKALPIFVKNIRIAKSLAEIGREQERILKRFWPGKATFVLRKRKGVRVFGVGKQTIGLRIPKYRLVNLIFSKWNRPLAETSVNISGGPVLTEIAEIIKHFEKRKTKPALIVDAGELKKSPPSAVIDLTKKKPEILRKGAKTLKL